MGENKQALKTFIGGYLTGMAIVWLLVLILPILAGVNNLMKFWRHYFDTFLSWSLIAGALMAVLFLISASARRKRQKREELEDVMKEYLQKKMNEENDG